MLLTREAAIEPTTASPSSAGTATGLIELTGAPLNGTLTSNEIDRLEELQQSSFLLAGIRFSAIGLGPTSLDVNYFLDNAYNDESFVGASVLDLTVMDPMVQIPEPGTTLLLGLGILVLSGVRRGRLASDTRSESSFRICGASTCPLPST